MIRPIFAQTLRNFYRGCYYNALSVIDHEDLHHCTFKTPRSTLASTRLESLHDSIPALRAVMSGMERLLCAFNAQRCKSSLV